MTDLVDRLREAYSDSSNLTFKLAADEIERLRERCEAYKGQVEVGFDYILRLRAALEEMVQVNAAFARTIVTAAATDDLKDELRAAGIADGFGARARAALGEPKP